MLWATVQSKYNTFTLASHALNIFYPNSIITMIMMIITAIVGSDSWLFIMRSANYFPLWFTIMGCVIKTEVQTYLPWNDQLENVCTDDCI